MIYHTALRVRAVNGHKVLGVLKFSLMVLGYYYIDTLRGFDSPIAHQTKSPLRKHRPVKGSGSDLFQVY